MLATRGLDLAPRTCWCSCSRTEGWPAGLYLAALSVRGRTGRRTAPSPASAATTASRPTTCARSCSADAGPGRRASFLQLRLGARRARGTACDALLGRRGSGDAAAAALARQRARRRRSTAPTRPTAATRCSRTCCGPSCGGPSRSASAGCTAARARGTPRRGDLDRAIGHAIEAGDAAARGALLWAAAGEPPARRPPRQGAALARAGRSRPDRAHPALALTAAAEPPRLRRTRPRRALGQRRRGGARRSRTRRAGPPGSR